ncbi:hypothetical protein MATL_G00049990 [Megalops atlanticus]|uniref:Homeobox domain-containing protein n=1 Tax=Megalops atlanticus TaxID=7932 RepID=A0A9D3QAA2_MEGAT|nr:hypothetical protein MATL_G00049990 [Megalops atlanticus]
MHCRGELRCSFPGKLIVARRRYKTFMIDEILSKDICDNFEKLSTCPMGHSVTRLKPLLSSFESSSLLVHPLFYIIAQQDSDLPHRSQPPSPGHLSHLPHQPPLSPQFPRAECPSSKTPVSISSESEVEQNTSQPRKSRRSRTIFSEHQLFGLEKKFQKQKYLSTPDRLDLARSLDLTQLQVKTWYQNRRMKWKKMVLEKGQEAPTKPKGRPKKNSIPTTEEIEAQERLAQLAQEERDLTHASGQGDTPKPEAQDSKSQNPLQPEGCSQEQSARVQTAMLIAS